MVELSAGHPVAAMQAAERLGEIAETALRARPELYEQKAVLISSLLIRALILLQSGRAPGASRAAEQAAERLDDGRAGFPGWERFCRGAVHGFFYALGRPKGPGRPAEPPGLKDHADRAIAEAQAADRLGYRNPRVMAMLNQLIGRPPAMQLVLMDQLFPFDPFQPEPGSEDDAARLRRTGTQAMITSSTSQDRNPVQALADEFLRRQHGGERPTLEEYCRRHPELADDIREVFPVDLLHLDLPDADRRRSGVKSKRRENPSVRTPFVTPSWSEDPIPSDPHSRHICTSSKQPNSRGKSTDTRA